MTTKAPKFRGPANNGRAQGKRLRQRELANQKKYPSISHRRELTNPNTGQTYRPMGGVYATPSERKNRFALKQRIMQSGVLAAPSDNDRSQVTTYNVTDDDIQFMQEQEDERNAKALDDYVLALFDPREPGNYERILAFSPETIHRMLRAVDGEFDLLKQKKLIEEFGPQDRDQLLLMYQIHQDSLQDRSPETDGYIRGMFNPRARPDTLVQGFLGWISGGRDARTRQNNRFTHAGARASRFHTMREPSDSRVHALPPARNPRDGALPGENFQDAGEVQ